MFSSFATEQVRVEDTESIGIKRLRDYLELAQKGVKVVENRRGDAQRLDKHRENIAQVLRARGLHMETAVGLSQFKIDLVVSRADKPEIPRLAIILDGEDWTSRKAVGDRGGLRQEVLEGVLKWPATMRIWLPEWLSNPSEVCTKVRARVDAADRLSASGLWHAARSR